MCLVSINGYQITAEPDDNNKDEDDDDDGKGDEPPNINPLADHMTPSRDVLCLRHAAKSSHSSLMRMHMDGQLDHHRAACFLVVFIMSQRLVNRDVSMGLVDLLHNLLGISSSTMDYRAILDSYRDPNVDKGVTLHHHHHHDTVMALPDMMPQFLKQVGREVVNAFSPRYQVVVVVVV